MALSTCAPCECPGFGYNSVDSYRQSVLVTLCSILSALGGDVTSTTATLTQVAYSASDTQLLASNDLRKANSTILNTSDANLYVGLGAGAVTTSAYTEKVYPGQSYTIPANYAGEVRGIWDNLDTNGGANITELA